MSVVKIFSCMTLVVAGFLGGCGGGSSPAVPATPAAPAASVAQATPDVTFTNVATDPGKTSVMPGERDVEVAALRMQWATQTRGGISQMVFTDDVGTTSLWKLFKSFRIVDSSGSDITAESRYTVEVNDTTHSITVDFLWSPWYPNDYGVVPQTYSLLADMNPLAPTGAKFAFSLSAVQMHDAGKTVASTVVGSDFTVMNVAGMELPVVTNASPSNIVVSQALVGSFVDLAGFSVACPADSTYGCILMGATFSTSGIDAPQLSVAGVGTGYGSSQDPADSTQFVMSNLWLTLQPGETMTFVVSGVVYQPNIYVHITDMEWMVGGQVHVSPVFPSGPDACGLMVADTSGCKG